MPRRRPEQRTETRSRILRGAALCFARDGFDRATLKQIAKQSELTVPTLYSYFEGKQGLLDALIADLVEEMDQLFDVLLPRGLTFPQKLELLLAHQFRWAEERRHAFQFLQNFHVPNALELRDSAESQNLSRTEEWIAAHASEGDMRCDPRLLAQVVEAVGASFFKRWRESGAEPGALVKDAVTATEIVLYGLAKEPFEGERIPL